VSNKPGGGRKRTPIARLKEGLAKRRKKDSYTSGHSQEDDRRGLGGKTSASRGKRQNDNASEINESILIPGKQRVIIGRESRRRNLA